MRLDNFSRKFRLVIVVAKLRTHSPYYDGDQKQRCRRGQPLPRERLGRRSGGFDWAKIRVNFPPQWDWGRLIQWSQPQHPAHHIQVHELSGAMGAMLEVAFEFGRPAATQFAVEIALKQGVGKFTLHGQPPCERNSPVRNTTGGGRERART